MDVLSRSFKDGDALDLEQHVQWQSSDFNAGAGRLMRSKEVRIHGIHARELVHVLDEYLRKYARTRFSSNQINRSRKGQTVVLTIWSSELPAASTIALRFVRACKA